MVAALIRPFFRLQMLFRAPRALSDVLAILGTLEPFSAGPKHTIERETTIDFWRREEAEQCLSRRQLGLC